MMISSSSEKLQIPLHHVHQIQPHPRPLLLLFLINIFLYFLSCSCQSENGRERLGFDSFPACTAVCIIIGNAFSHAATTAAVVAVDAAVFVEDDVVGVNVVAVAAIKASEVVGKINGVLMSEIEVVDGGSG